MTEDERMEAITAEYSRMLVAATWAAYIYLKKSPQTNDYDTMDDAQDLLVDADIIVTEYSLEDNDVVYRFTDSALDEIENFIGAPDKELLGLFGELLEVYEEKKEREQKETEET